MSSARPAGGGAKGVFSLFRVVAAVSCCGDRGLKAGLLPSLSNVSPGRAAHSLPDYLPAVLLNNRLLTIFDSQRVAALLLLYYAEAVSRLTYARRSPSPSRLISPPSLSSIHLLRVYLSSVDCAGVPAPPRQHQTLFTLLLKKPEGTRRRAAL